jgi:hypothetical protein
VVRVCSVRIVSLIDGLLGTSAYTPSPVPVEGAIGRWTASRLVAGLTITGAEVVVTRGYLVFTPWDMTRTREFLVKLLSRAGVPHIGDLDKLLTATKLLEPIAIPLSQITSVQPMGRASVPTPPWARIGFGGGRHLDVAILAGVRFPNFHPANNAAFDDWLAAMRAVQLEAAGAGTPQSPVSAAEPEIDLEAIRAQAMASGAAITIATEGNYRFYVTPDGVVRAAIGSRSSRPTGAVISPSFVGSWRSEGFGPGEVIVLNLDGTVTGRVQLFGALPPLDLRHGSWWTDGASTVSVRGDVWVPELGPYAMYFELGGTFRVTHVGRELAVADWLDGDPEGQEVVMRRAA